MNRKPVHKPQARPEDRERARKLAELRQRDRSLRSGELAQLAAEYAAVRRELHGARLGR